jgi:hopanoid biosynthesis associated protein HpnK
LSVLVVTADDFGLAGEVNDAVEIGHRKGILSAASLMIAAPRAADAVGRARTMPRLRVGLHLALTDASPALPPAEIPDLVDRHGRLRADLVMLAMRLAFSERARHQMRAEIEAQFCAYRATKLSLDHVTVHQHFHLHPMVAEMVIEIAMRYGARALRTPLEPWRIVGPVDRGGRRGRRAVERVCAALIRAKARRAGLLTPDAVFGLRWSGRMTVQRLCPLLRGCLPSGLCEIYMHPATRNVFPGHAPGYRYVDELTALLAPETSEALRKSGHRLGGYQDLSDSKSERIRKAAIDRAGVWS